MTDIAIIDIGSNSIRLVCYEADYMGFNIIYNEKTVCGLGENLDKGGKLSIKGVKLATKAIEQYYEYAQKMKMEDIIAIATAAVRESTDGEKFVQTIKKKNGLKIRVLSGDEESQYAAYGVISAYPDARGMTGDLGGGSLDIACIAADMPYDPMTLPIGVLILQAQGARCENYVRNVIAGMNTQYKKDQIFYAVGGSWRALAKAYQIWDGKSEPNSHGFEVAPAKIYHFLDIMPLKQPKQLISDLGVNPMRAPQLSYAATALKCLIDEFKFKSIKFCNAGLRDGLLYTLTQEVQHTLKEQDKRTLS